MLSHPGNLLVGLGILSVSIVLFLGLVNMMRGGSPKFSQKLMRWRIGLQFVTILIILGVLWFREGI